jgi:hypothetical protein
MERVSLVRWMLALLGVLIAAGVIYDSAVFYSRWSDARQAKQQRAAAEANHEQRVVEALGGDGLKIISFYAVNRGGQTEICYGVTGAKTVRIEPPLGDLWPALSRCMQASLKRDTRYRLVAEDGAGHSATQSLPPK